MTMMPTDANSHPIPALRLRSGAAHVVAVTATSNRNSVAFNAATRVIGVYATVPMFIRFGDNTVTAAATDHYLPADTYMDIAVAADDVQSAAYVAAVRSVSDGTLYISEKF